MNIFYGKTPFGMWILENAWGEIIEEALELGMNPNQLNFKKQNLIHRAIELSTDFNITLKILRKMDHNWWKPDKNGLTPLHLPIHCHQTSHMIITKWWTENLSWKLLKEPFDPMDSNLPQAKYWNEWKSILRP